MEMHGDTGFNSIPKRSGPIPRALAEGYYGVLGARLLRSQPFVSWPPWPSQPSPLPLLPPPPRRQRPGRAAAVTQVRACVACARPIERRSLIATRIAPCAPTHAQLSATLRAIETGIGPPVIRNRADEDRWAGSTRGVWGAHQLSAALLNCAVSCTPPANPGCRSTTPPLACSSPACELW